MVKISYILQKGNSGGQWRWGCSAFEVLALVANERPARVGSAKAVSAILHSCIMAQESRECSHNAQLCKHSFGKGFCSVPILATLFNGCYPLPESILKSVAGNYHRAKAQKWKGERHGSANLAEY